MTTPSLDVLLLLMIAVYLVPLLIVAHHAHATHTSVSHVAASASHTPLLAASLALLCVLALLYEHKRYDEMSYTSWALIGIAVGLAGLLANPVSTGSTTTHYLFAAVTFAAIYTFMYLRSSSTRSGVQMWSMRLQTALAFLIPAGLLVGIPGTWMFWPETLFILNFAFYFVAAH